MSYVSVATLRIEQEREEIKSSYMVAKLSATFCPKHFPPGACGAASVVKADDETSQLSNGCGNSEKDNY